MRIGIISDTHDQIRRTGIATRLLMDQGAEILIHCGDITIPDIVYEFHVLPTYFVFGNCDDQLGHLEKAMVAVGGTCLGRGECIGLAGRKLAVTHGDSDRELTRLISLSPDFLFTGHTHRAMDKREGTIRRINPGALHRASFWSVALLDLVSDSLEFLRIEP